MRAFLALCLFALAFQQGLALQCHSCASTGDTKNCADPFNATSIPPCSLADNILCMKTIISLGDGEGNRKLLTSRACVPTLLNVNPCQAFIEEQNQYAKVEHCSTCNTDFCNSGPKSATISIFGLVSLVVLGVKNVL